MARRKVYKGIVLKPFRLKKLYLVGNEYKSTDKRMYNHLINTKRIK